MPFLVQNYPQEKIDLSKDLMSLLAKTNFSFTKENILWQFVNLGEKLLIEDARFLKKQSRQIKQKDKIAIFVLDLNNCSRLVQNSLLKIIEEPPTGTDFILLTRNLSLVLPTLISRCQILSLPLLMTEKEALQILNFWQIDTWFETGPVKLAQNWEKIFLDDYKKLLEGPPQTEDAPKKSLHLFLLLQQLIYSLTFFLDQPKNSPLTLDQLTDGLIHLQTACLYLQNNISPKNTLYFLALALKK